MISIGGLNYDLWLVVQVFLAFVVFKKFKEQVKKFQAINTLVLIPLAPILALVLYVLSRIKNKDYFYGYVFLLPMFVVIVMMKSMGPLIYVFSIVITAVCYTWHEFMLLEDKEDNMWLRVLKACRPVFLAFVIGKLCKGMNNPISFIICCNIFSDYIIGQYTNINKLKWNRDGYDADNGRNWNLLAGFMESVFIGAPSDLVTRSKPIVDGLIDALCIMNLLVNGTQRGSAGIVVTGWSTAIVFFTIVAIIYMYGNLEDIKEEDKVWPAVMNYDVPKITKLQLLIVTLSLTFGYTLSSTSLLDAGMLVGKLALVTALCMFVRIKVVTSVYFSTNVF